MADFNIAPESYASVYDAYPYNPLVLLEAVIQNNDTGQTEIITLNRFIKALNIYHLYSKCAFPICTVTLSLTQSIHERIAKNLENTVFKLSVDIIKSLDSEKILKFENQDTGLMTISIIKDLILVANEFDKTRRPNEEAEKANGGFKGVGNIVITVDLLSKEHLKMQKDIITGVYENCNLSNLLSSLLSKLQLKMLVHPVQNQKVIPQLVLPSKNIVQTIKNLQKTYGLYEKGLRLYFDYDRGYCLSNDTIAQPILVDETKNEYKTTIFFLGRNELEKFGSFKDSATMTNYIVAPNPYNMTFKDTSVPLEEGSNVLVQAYSQELNKIQNMIQTKNNQLVEANKKISNEVNKVNKQFQEKLNLIETAKQNVNSTVQKYVNTINQSISNSNKVIIGKINKGTETLSKSLNSYLSSAISKQTMQIKDANLNKIVTNSQNQLQKIAQDNINKLNQMATSLVQGQFSKFQGLVSSQISKTTTGTYKTMGSLYGQSVGTVNGILSKEISQLNGIMGQVNSAQGRVMNAINGSISGINGKINSSLSGISGIAGGIGGGFGGGIAGNSSSRSGISGIVTSATGINGGRFNALKNANLNDDLMQKEKIVYQNFDNTFLQSSKAAEESKDYLNFKIVAKNIDPTFLTPNKQVQIVFYNKNYKEFIGTYQVTDYIWSFSQLSPHLYDSVCTINLCKLIKNELANQ